MISDIAAYVAFAAVVEEGSLAAAARRLGSSKTAVSRYVARLEALAGVKLVNRTSRKLGLTTSGAELLRNLWGALAALERDLGLGTPPAVAVNGRLRDSRLASVLEEFLPPERPICVARRPTRRMPGKLRAFIEFIRCECPTRQLVLAAILARGRSCRTRYVDR